MEKGIWSQGYLNFCAGAPTDEGLGGSLYEWELVCNLPWTSLVNGDEGGLSYFRCWCLRIGQSKTHYVCSHLFLWLFTCSRVLSSPLFPLSSSSSVFTPIALVKHPCLVSQMMCPKDAIVSQQFGMVIEIKDLMFGCRMIIIQRFLFQHLNGMDI